MQTDEENTRWVEVWAVNSVDYHGQLQDAATEGPEELRGLVEQLWKSADDGTTEHIQAREMTDSDYDRVDWAEVAKTLLDGATPWLTADEEVPYPVEEWDEAVAALARGDETGSDLETLLEGLDEQDEGVLRANVGAAHERYGPQWTISEFHLVVLSLSASYGDGWAGLANDYLDDHFPGLPTQWLRDLDAIGQEVKRDSEQYVLLDDVLYVFNKEAGE